uniref:Zinc finger GATA like protein 1 n=1 Tax=Sarcophilus harrisii TaxID=9305 RepID=A0A7N4PFR4_SARHA
SCAGRTRALQRAGVGGRRPSPHRPALPFGTGRTARVALPSGIPGVTPGTFAGFSKRGQPGATPWGPRVSLWALGEGQLIPLPARPRTPWLALPAAVTGLRFLQETAELLPQAPVPEAPRAEPWLEPPLPPRTLAPVPVPGGPRAWDAADSLALISLQCHRLSPPRTRKQVGLGVGLGRGPGLQALAGRTLRKQPHPQRGAEGQEPGFQGVVLRMHLKPAQEGHQLLITAQFSSACGSRSWGASASPAEALPNPVGASTSNHQDSPGSRCCASCRTQRTPLWRDAEDGTPLCNACGIRYKKYGIRCPACWTVPRKSICPLGHCTRCGAWLCTPQGPLGKGTEGHDSGVRPRVPRLHGEKEKSFPRDLAVRTGEGAGIPTGLERSPDEMWIPVPVGRPEP